MSFYYPLTLGVRRPKPVAAQSGGLPLAQAYDTWREGVERLAYAYEESPEASVFEALQWLAPTPGSRLWVILGEPGAGKTTLLETWFTRWAAQLSGPLLGTVVPVLVRLRDVQATHATEESELFADWLWHVGVSEKALLEGAGEAIYRHDRGRWYHPVWLFDGLDEVTPPPGERFYQALMNLPGLKVLSCRTAIYETLRREADRYKDREYELLALTPPQQKAFLIHAWDGDAPRADALHRRLQHHRPLRLLAGNPLMLSLIAHMPEQMVLPATRAEFYYMAVSELWRRRLSHHPEALLCVDQRDHVLADLAQGMGMTRMRAPLPWLVQAADRAAGAQGRSLVGYLKQAGLVRFHPWEQVDFVHLTVHEFYLARALRARGLQQVLTDSWHDARYEETLGLLIAMLFQAQRHEEINRSLQWLVAWGEATHRHTPSVLWYRRRSPLRVAAHLLHRAGVPLEHLPSTASVLWEKIGQSLWRQWAMVMDASTPSWILKTLAPDAIERMRQYIAAHPNTPPDTLARLTRHANPHVRWQAARHPSTPPETLAQLAQDRDSYMRWIVAGNPSTPPETLTRLATDTGAHMRQGTELDLLARHAGDIHQAVATNPSTPPETRTRLGQDTERGMHRTITRPPSAPQETVASLASHADPNMRRRAAGHPSTPSELLAQLAQDADRYVRQAVAANPGTSPELLTELASDADPHVRQGVAINPSAPPELLARLAQDTDTNVHWGVAMNPSTLLEDL